MALQDILKKIQAQGEAQIVKIEQEFAEKKKDVDQEFEALTAQELKALEAKTAEALQEVDRKIDTMARRENRQALLRARRSMLDKAMESFIQSLVNGSKDVKAPLYQKLAGALSVQSGTISVAKGDKALLEASLKGDFKVSESDDIKGGFICHSGGLEVDNTFENLVFSEYRESLEMHFADQLKLH